MTDGRGGFQVQWFGILLGGFFGGVGSVDDGGN